MENAFSEPCPNCSVPTKVEPYVTIFSFFQEFYPREIFLTVKTFYTQRLPHVPSLSSLISTEMDSRGKLLT